MDFSRLDTSLAASVCVPGQWKLTKENASEITGVMPNVAPASSLVDLLNATVPTPGTKSNPCTGFEIPIVKVVTPDMKLELAAIRLRRYAYKDKFMKSSDSKEIPNRFYIGTMVGGGLQAVGAGGESQAAGTTNRRKKSGKSHLMNLLHDDSVKEWLQKNIEKRTRVARPKTKHPKVTRRNH